MVDAAAHGQFDRSGDEDRSFLSLMRDGWVPKQCGSVHPGGDEKRDLATQRQQRWQCRGRRLDGE